MKKPTLSLGSITITNPAARPLRWLYITPTVGGRSVLQLRADIKRGRANATLLAAYTPESVMEHGHVVTLKPHPTAMCRQVTEYLNDCRERSMNIGNLDRLTDYNTSGAVTFDDLMRIADKPARAQLTEGEESENTAPAPPTATTPPRPPGRPSNISQRPLPPLRHVSDEELAEATAVVREEHAEQERQIERQKAAGTYVSSPGQCSCSPAETRLFALMDMRERGAPKPPAPLTSPIRRPMTLWPAINRRVDEAMALIESLRDTPDKWDDQEEWLAEVLRSMEPGDYVIQEREETCCLAETCVRRCIVTKDETHAANVEQDAIEMEYNDAVLAWNQAYPDGTPEK